MSVCDHSVMSSEEFFFNSFYEVGKSTLHVITFSVLFPGNSRPANGVCLRHSCINSFLKAALFMGLVMGLQVGRSTKARLAYSVSEKQQSILYCYSPLHQNLFPYYQRTECTGCSYKAFNWQRNTTGYLLLLQISGYLKAPSSGGRKGWLTRLLYLQMYFFIQSYVVFECSVTSQLMCRINLCKLADYT